MAISIVVHFRVAYQQVDLVPLVREPAPGSSDNWRRSRSIRSRVSNANHDSNALPAANDEITFRSFRCLSSSRPILTTNASRVVWTIETFYSGPERTVHLRRRGAQLEMTAACTPLGRIDLDRGTSWLQSGGVRALRRGAGVTQNTGRLEPHHPAHPMRCCIGSRRYNALVGCHPRTRISHC